MIRHTQQIGGVTVNFTVGRLDDMPRCASCGRALCGCTDDQFKGASVKPAPDSFKIADWPLHERPDVWAWGDGVRLAESTRAELGSSFLHGEPYVDQ